MTDITQLCQKADTLAQHLRDEPQGAHLDHAVKLLDDLRKMREFDRLTTLAELVSRHRPGQPLVRRLLAQGLVELGKATVAVDVARVALQAAQAQAHSEVDELSGVLGRAYKQIFMDDPTTSSAAPSPGARAAIEASVAAYEYSWLRKDKANTWHGINLAAMLHVAAKCSLKLGSEATAESVARAVLDRLVAVPVTERDNWWHATKAEAHVALKDWRSVSRELGMYLKDTTVSPFHFAATLRQFRDVWQIQETAADGAQLLRTLEAAFLGCQAEPNDPAGKPALVASASHLARMRALPDAAAEHLQASFSMTDLQTVRWYRAGLDRASAVAAIRRKLGKRLGTGFAVRAEDFGGKEGEIFVLTNHHVVNAKGAGQGARPADVELFFEVADPALGSALAVAEVVAESPELGGLDYSLLRLTAAPKGVVAVPLAQELPDLSAECRVYVIGHAEGHELQFSLQDNYLLDHEGPPGNPPRADRLRVHYRTRTERGSSGSPVFDDVWNCIALHHAGARQEAERPDSGMRRLNQKEGYYSANEGIWIRSIRGHVLSGSQV